MVISYLLHGGLCEGFEELGFCGFKKGFAGFTPFNLSIADLYNLKSP